MNFIKKYLKDNLSDASRVKLQNFVDDFRAFGFGQNLDKLGRIYRTDKTGSHSYLEHYQLHLKKFKYKKINLLEIGVGGYKDPFYGAHSLRMWKKYFP